MQLIAPIRSSPHRLLAQNGATPYDVHIKFRGINTKSVVDLSEERLKRMIRDSRKNKSIREKLTLILENYIAGRLGLCWHKGHPVTVNVIRDN